MYYVSKRLEISASHKLNLSYESKCANLHGHNWIITVCCKAEKLNEDGMVMDFKHIKQKIHGYLDHGNLNELLPFNPTAENIAKWIADQLTGMFDGIYVKCTRVSVEESAHNTAIYEVKGGCNCGR